ncbi:MAG: hypothetical protein AAF957_20930 [Planctomycetota bacterium]
MPTSASTAPGLVYWLPLDEAVLRFDVDRKELTAAVRRGDIDVRAKVVGGDVVASVCSTELTSRYGPPRSAPLEAPTSTPAPAPEDLAEERRERERLEGQLAASERLERGLQRYADRLEERSDREREAYEEKLAQAELMRLQLARVVGRLEAEVTRLQSEIDAQAVRALPAASPPAQRSAHRSGWRRWLRR